MTLGTLDQTGRDDENHVRQGGDQFGDVVATIKDYYIGLLSPDGIILTWNAGGQSLTGYSDRDIIGQSFERFYTPEARAAGRPGLLLATARAEGRAEDVDWRVRKDGTRFWADVVITALRGERGRTVGFATVTRDLTAKPQEAQAFLLRAGEELADSLDYEATAQHVVRQAVPSLADVCFVDLVEADSHLRPLAVAHVDPAKERWWLERVRDADESPPIMRRAVRTGLPLMFESLSESEMRTIADEEHVPLDPLCVLAQRELSPSSVICIPLAARGHILGVLTLVRLDASKPFVPYDQLLIQQLAHQCALALDNARLYREATDAIRERDEFLATITHELRRPLSEIKGFATTLLREDVRWDEPTRQDFLHEIDSEADLLDALIKDLLDMSSLESGASRYFERAPVPLPVLVSGSIDRVRRRTSRVALDIDPDLGALPAVWIDARRIEHVLVNLLENATKYAPGSPIRVSGRVVNAGQEVELWVEDDGPGIPAEDLAHIFDKLYRGQSAQRSEMPGTGLGLAIAQAIVEGHGGQIRAENRPGGGARFVVRLPVASRLHRRQRASKPDPVRAL